MYLMAGAGTNVPELLTITKMIGKRASAMYFAMVTTMAFISGYITNRLLMPNFKPVLDYDRTSRTISQVNKMTLDVPEWGRWLCSFIVIAYAIVALIKYIRKDVIKHETYSV